MAKTSTEQINSLLKYTNLYKGNNGEGISSSDIQRLMASLGINSPEIASIAPYIINAGLNLLNKTNNEKSSPSLFSSDITSGEISGVSGVGNAITSAASSAVNAAPSIGELLAGASQEAKKADQEVKEGIKNAESLEKAIKKSQTQTKKNIDKIIKLIEKNAKLVEDKLKEIDKHTKEKEEIENKLQKQKDIIDANAAIVNSEESTLEEKRTALKNISAAGQAISALSSEVELLASKIAEEAEEVTNTQSDINDLNSESETVINNGQKETDNYNKQLDIQNKNNEKIAANAATNEANAVALELAAKEAQAGGSILGFATFGLGNLTAEATVQKLNQAARDNRKAAQTRTQGNVKIAAKLTTIGSKIQQYSTSLTEYRGNVENAIGAANTTIQNYFDASNAIGSALIDSNALNEASEKIQSSVELSTNKLDGKNVSEKSEENNPDNKLFNYNTEELKLESLIKSEK